MRCERTATAALFLIGLWSISPAVAAGPPPGATSCSGCHSATVATAVPRLAGRKPEEIVAAMQAFRAGTRPNTVMGRIAKGFTDPEVEAIAAWYATQ